MKFVFAWQGPFRRLAFSELIALNCGVSARPRSYAAMRAHEGDAAEAVSARVVGGEVFSRESRRLRLLQRTSADVRTLLSGCDQSAGSYALVLDVRSSGDACASQRGPGVDIRILT